MSWPFRIAIDEKLNNYFRCVFVRFEEAKNAHRSNAVYVQHIHMYITITDTRAHTRIYETIK